MQKTRPSLNPALKPFWLAKYIRNRILYGGRSSSKSWDAAGMLLFIASNYRIRALCTRHFQNKLADSVYTLLKLRAEEFGIYDQFKFTDSNIFHPETGSEVLFYGRARNINEIRSLENIDIHWGEECALMTKAEWDIIEPTIRKEGSQNWLIFNPRYKTDFVYERFVLNPPPDTLVRKINYDENPFLSSTMRKIIEAAKAEDYDDYLHKYEGVPLENNEASLIKSAWIEAAIDAHIKLGIEITGARKSALDVADEGDDLNAQAFIHGILIDNVETWSGKGLDIFKTTEKAIMSCLDYGLDTFSYDADGLGAAVRGDAKVIAQKMNRTINTVPFRGSSAVINPKNPISGLHNIAGRDKIERTNEDYYRNFKAQAWHNLALRFERTYRAVVNNEKFDTSDLISINSNMKNLQTLKLELEQPQRKDDGAGKMLIDKKPEGFKSPNMADSIMMVFAPTVKRNSLFG